MLIRAIEALNIRLGVLAGAGTVLLILSVVPDLISRSLFGIAIYGMSEAGIALLVFIIFLALPAAQVRKEHFYIAVLDAKLSPPVLRMVVIIRYLVSASITGLFTWYSITSAWESTLRLEQSYAVIAFPVWPARITVACGFFLLTLQLLIDAVRAFKGQCHSPSPSDLPTA